MRESPARRTAVVDLRDGAPAGGREAAPSALVDQRPWGSFEQLVLNERVTVKVITVAPGQRLSLQRHEQRDEWWQVLDEGLRVEVDGRSWCPAVGERVWIPAGAEHRAGATGACSARLLEVAFGTFDEGDIERLEDDYARPLAPCSPGAVAAAGVPEAPTS